MADIIKFEMSLPDASPSRQAALLMELQQALRSDMSSDTGDFQSNLVKKDQSKQDLGTILAVMLGAEATIVLAYGISAWMKRRNQARIRIKGVSGKEVDITNVESKHIAELLANLE